VRDAGEIERAVAALARSANGGLIVTPSGGTSVHRDLIITLAARHKLPALYSDRFNVLGARALGLTVPASLLAPRRRGDRIECIHVGGVRANMSR